MNARIIIAVELAILTLFSGSCTEFARCEELPTIPAPPILFHEYGFAGRPVDSRPNVMKIPSREFDTRPLSPIDPLAPVHVPLLRIFSYNYCDLVQPRSLLSVKIKHLETNPDLFGRHLTVKHLQGYGGRAVYDALARIVRNDPDAEVRAIAFVGLEEIARPVENLDLSSQLKSDNPRLCIAAAKFRDACERAEASHSKPSDHVKPAESPPTKPPIDVDRYLKLLASGGRTDRNIAVHYLCCSRDPRVVDPLMAELKDHSNESLIFPIIDRLLETRDPKIVEPLVKIVENIELDPKLRARAIQSLAFAKPDRAYPLLKGYSIGGTFPVQAAAVKTIARFEEPKFRMLLEKSKSSKDPYVRAAAYIEDAKLNPEEAPRRLYPALLDRDSSVRLGALRHLCRLVDQPDVKVKSFKPTVDYLLDMIQHDDLPHAVNAITALRLFDDGRIVSALLGYLNIDRVEEWIRQHNEYYLRDRYYGERLEEMIPDPAAFVAIASLGLIGERSVVPSLLKFLDVPDVSMRATAIKTLGQLGDDRAVEPLIERFVIAEIRTCDNNNRISEHRDVLHGEEIATALGRIGGYRAREFLIDMRDYGAGPMKKYAAVGLEAMKPE